MRLPLFVVLLAVSLRLSAAFPTHEDENEETHRDEVDGESSRKIIGQSVVTSVSVIMNGDGEEPHFTDAVGKTVPRPRVPPKVASPINLLNPDRYEFYTFNDEGELVKRLMTLKEIQSIVANGNGAVIGDNEPESQSVLLNTIPLSNQGSETRVQDIVDNVQNVLSREMENNKNISHIPSQLLDTPDVSSSWSMILPAIFGNTGDEILPHKPINMTPETDVVDTTTTKFKPTTTTLTTTTTKVPLVSKIVATTKASTTLKATTKAPKTTKAPVKTTQTSPKTTQTSPITSAQTSPPTSAQTSPETSQTYAPKTVETSAVTKTVETSAVTKSQTPAVTPTEKTTLMVKPKPSLSPRTTTTTPRPVTETSPTELPKTTFTQKPTTIKKIVKKPTFPSGKRPLTNSPIVIERIEKKPLVVESKTEGVELEKKTEPTTQMKTTSSSKTTVMKKTETSTTKMQTSSEKPKISTTTKQSVPETTVSMDQTTLLTSEEDRQDSAINQIIGSLQSDLFKTYERITTIDPPNEETTIAAMEKTGEIILVPDKISLNEQLYIDEPEPIIRTVPPTTSVPEDEATTDAPTFDKLEATTKANTKTDSGNKEIMEKIESLIKEQINAKTKKQPEKLDILGFDDDDETEIQLKETLESKKNISHSLFVTKAATAASILSTKLMEEATTVEPITDENDTTVPTILSEALSDVIQLMIKDQESKIIVEEPTTVAEKLVADEPSESDLTRILHHYENFNAPADQLEALSMISETFVATAKQPEVTTTKAEDSYEATVVKETSSVSMKLGEDSKKPEPTTSAPEKLIPTTDPSKAEFSTFFLVDHDETTSDEVDKFGEFTTEQFVVSEKRFSERKEEVTTAITPAATTVPAESDEESSELVSDVLNAIGIASDEEDEASTGKLKINVDSQESDEVESAIINLSSTIDKTLTTDVKTDFTLTSKIASSLISVADSISETLGSSNLLGVGDEESEEVTLIPTTVASVKKQEVTTEKVASEVTEKLVEEVTTIEPEVQEAVTEETSEKIVEETSEKLSTKEESTEKESISKELDDEQPAKDAASPMVQLSIIRKDNSLEEIEYLTPPSVTEVNFVRIDNIEASTNVPKLSGVKNKVQEVENVKPIYIALRTTTQKIDQLAEVSTAQAINDESSKLEIATERVPLIEVTKTTVAPSTTTEDNLVEVKVQTVVVPTLIEEIPTSTISQLLPNLKTIKNTIKNSQQPQPRPPSPPIDLSSTPGGNLGLAASTANLNSDLSEFSKLCNELAFTFWKSITADGISQSRSVVISPFALTSMLSMIFLGARGQTSGEMNDLLKLDDMVSFNPHVIFRNISESIEQSRKSGIAAAAFVRELYSDRANGKLLPYFKEKAQQFYGAHVEEVNFNVVNDILRRRTNLLVKRHTFSKINEYLKTNNIWVNDPLAAVSANVFLTDCSGTTMSERDGEMFFQVSPAIRQRRLIPIPAAVYRSGFTAGYDPILDATAVAFGDDLQSTILVMPGQQGSSIPGDNLDRLETAFMDSSTDAFGRLLTTFMERPGLEVQIPRFSHRSLINTTYALQQMGLKDIFDANKADLRGLTGAKSNDLYFSDMMQINQFSTCGEDKIGDSHHIEIYPSPSLKRDVNGDDESGEEDGKLEISSTDKTNMQYKSLFFDPIYDSRYMNVPLPLRPRQARLPENPRLRFDRPFLYFVRHNPTGIILFMGRFNPRLLP